MPETPQVDIVTSHCEVLHYIVRCLSSLRYPHRLLSALRSPYSTCVCVFCVCVCAGQSNDVTSIYGRLCCFLVEPSRRKEPRGNSIKAEEGNKSSERDRCTNETRDRYNKSATRLQRPPIPDLLPAVEAGSSKHDRLQIYWFRSALTGSSPARILSEECSRLRESIGQPPDATMRDQRVDQILESLTFVTACV